MQTRVPKMLLNHTQIDTCTRSYLQRECVYDYCDIFLTLKNYSGQVKSYIVHIKFTYYELVLICRDMEFRT